MIMVVLECNSDDKIDSRTENSARGSTVQSALRHRLSGAVQQKGIKSAGNPEMEGTADFCLSQKKNRIEKRSFLCNDKT